MQDEAGREGRAAFEYPPASGGTAGLGLSVLQTATSCFQKESGSQDYFLLSCEIYLDRCSDGPQKIHSNKEKVKIPGRGGGGRKETE